MALVGTIFKGAVHLNEKLRQNRRNINQSQEITLKKLLAKAAKTQFGRDHRFEEVLNSDEMISDFRHVPLFDYDSLYRQYWKRSLAGEKDICWPGQVNYFALTSGTSGAPSKQIPVTADMLLAMRKAGFRHFCTLKDHNMPASFYQKGILLLGGSTHLTQVGSIYEGDLSGILAGNLPPWLNFFYRPGKAIAQEKDWNKKLDLITKEAEKWDIGIVAGVPAWVQLLLERIIDKYKLTHIHDIWPNFKVYVHGGVYFGPYRSGFSRLLGHEINFLETYLASEGFIAFERLHGTGAMSLVLDNGIYYEFIPFGENHFDSDGKPLPDAKSLSLSEVEENIDYAVVISTCAGTWRYLIGDTVRFTNAERQELVITGRIKHFISLCGEHLSVDNMNDAVCRVAREMDINIREFTMSGLHHENLFAHKWWIGSQRPADEKLLTIRLDEALKELNDDYRTERSAAIKEVFVEVLPNQVFYDWMSAKGKLGGQNKFPRVLTDSQRKDWEAFIAGRSVQQWQLQL